MSLFVNASLSNGHALRTNWSGAESLWFIAARLLGRVSYTHIQFAAVDRYHTTKIIGNTPKMAVNRRNKIAGVLYHRGVLVLIFVPIIDKHRHIQFLYVFCEGSTRQLFFSSVNRFHKQTLAWLPSWQNWKCRWSFGSNRGPRWMMHGT